MDLKELEDLLELSENNATILLKSILDNIEIKNNIIVSDSIYTDTTINNWATSNMITRGGNILMDKFIKNPIYDINLLIKRQEVNYELFNYQLETLKNNEKDILWIMTLKKDIEDDMSINLLYPSTIVINKFNNYRIFLDSYHFYKIFIMPISCLIYPLSIILGPYYYLNNYIKIYIPFSKYLYLLFNLLKIMCYPSGNIKTDITKIITIIIYIAIYIYSIYHTIMISYIIYKTREKLLIKLKGLVNFIKTAIVIIKRSNYCWLPYFLYNHQISKEDVNEAIINLEKLKYDLSTIYKLWKNDKYKSYIIIILKIIYTIDIINFISKLRKNINWCTPVYNNLTTKIWDIKNPLLSDSQISNPVNLHKNFIITGVNAGGKTTYVKSIISNIILAQTFGIINASKGNISIYDAIVSFMRISDEVGIKSYFEAETECCSNMIEIANKINKENKKGLFVLDEPMHSTPPIEGMSVAYSIAKYLGKLKGISIIITTHFHKLIELENEDNSNFINLSVNAKKNNIKDTYEFDYKICKGGSKQTIAIELLKKHKLNDEIINHAINIKNSAIEIKN
jgi:DNA mismatch repair ATPase MutS